MTFVAGEGKGWRDIGAACGEAIAELLIETCPAIDDNSLDAALRRAGKRLRKIMQEKGARPPDVAAAADAMASAFRSRLQRLESFG
ncbi:MAG: hypothetical protein JO107_13555 [Hyphomicrobiales bacterium]|nr:hypothetical protein [Hyphomicrobiales bacterium]MBV8664116.1 hypothetical protein [Hyphomicrobiales bacterium]